MADVDTDSLGTTASNCNALHILEPPEVELTPVAASAEAVNNALSTEGSSLLPFGAPRGAQLHMRMFANKAPSDQASMVSLKSFPGVGGVSMNSAKGRESGRQSQALSSGEVARASIRSSSSSSSGRLVSPPVVEPQVNPENDEKQEMEVARGDGVENKQERCSEERIEDEEMPGDIERGGLVPMEDHGSAVSSFYYGSDMHSNAPSLMIIGGDGGTTIGTTIGGGEGEGEGEVGEGAGSVSGLTPTVTGVPSGSFNSPPHTLVNSDGASLRVHTGSIRERNYYLRASGTNNHGGNNEGENDPLYYDSRRSESLFGRGSTLSRRRMSSDEAGFSDGDRGSMVSGFSEGGASTTRVRMATDLAYNALRIGPQSSNFSYYANSGGGGGAHRALSFATSSDPGLPSAASFYDYYMDAADNEGNAVGSANDEEDIISLIRSDVAVYGGAGDDVKFPFLNDNLSEFSGSIIYSPSGQIGVDAERFSRELSETSYARSAQHQEQPQQQQRQQGRGKLTRRGNNSRAIMGGSNNAALAVSVSPRGATRAVAAAVASGSGGSSGGHRHSRRYRRQSASEAYQNATSVVVVAAAAAAAASASASGSSERRQQDIGASGPANIKPNAIMRFIKRITPKN
ncbi:hypothetical protein GQ54DRAFT_301192 [Martensiomyces pterosporus]|nr:hypothetical protein GQ54DRAFT_301192 [Martensiomyces pterosporus]